MEACKLCGKSKHPAQVFCGAACSSAWESGVRPGAESPNAIVEAPPEVFRRVYLESPYAGNIPLHVAYARACMADCLAKGEAPFASHLLYTQEGVLDDSVPGERSHGINAGFAWGLAACATVLYVDFGISNGMKGGIEAAEKAGRVIEYRRLAPEVVLRLERAHA